MVPEPRAFLSRAGFSVWSEKLRSCAEALSIVLFENHSQLLGPVVVSILQEDMSGYPSAVNEIIPALLLKDVAYGVAAYIYYELSNYLSFKDWYVLFMLGKLLNQIALTPQTCSGIFYPLTILEMASVTR
ncbi:hypothetical protein MTR67_018113 [Solanum verrucosum]|uniref:Uncharacterized protein n=1 Tax=Solanum verrucosum TaxID=315347 RepID=A0AAF0TT61_SOLVR|nr:hypothetical protein MTR67_018113 [Solanum verrucosum]